MRRLIPFIALVAVLATSAVAQTAAPSDKAKVVIAKAVAAMGGEKFLNVKTLVAKGRYSQIREGANSSSQTFLDIIVYPGSERTEFKSGKVKTVQTNSGSTGWIYQGETEAILDQTEKQVADFKASMDISLDNLLREFWKGRAEITYVGRRNAGIGKLSEVIRLTYKTGEWVEFEFGSDGLPIKSLYRKRNEEDLETKEEDRYGQFIDLAGIKYPFVVDHYIDGIQTARINYESVDYNLTIPPSVFAKPSNTKELRKDLKF